MRNLDDVPRQLRSFRSKNYHAADGLCDKCQNRVRRRLKMEMAKVRERELDTERVVAALSQRYDVAQWLLNRDDEDAGIIGSLPGRST